jgi:hypothetical protein
LHCCKQALPEPASLQKSKKDKKEKKSKKSKGDEEDANPMQYSKFMKGAYDSSSEEEGVVSRPHDLPAHPRACTRAATSADPEPLQLAPNP